MYALVLRFIVPVTAGFALLTGLAAGWGKVSSRPTSFITANPCALPCVFGITPGTTNSDEALAIMEQVAPDNFTYSPVSATALFFRIDGDTGSVLGQITFNLPNNSLVRSAGFSPFGAEDDLGSLGDLMAAGLRPTRVFRSCDTFIPRMLIAFGDEAQVMAELRLGDRLRPETPITFLRVSTSGSTTFTEALTSFGCNVETGWRGFVPRRVYIS